MCLTTARRRVCQFVERCDVVVASGGQEFFVDGRHRLVPFVLVCDIRLVVGFGIVFFGEFFVFVAQDHAVGENGEPSEEWPLQGISEVLEGSRAGLESGPLPPGEAEEANDDDGEQDEVPPPHADFGAHDIMRVLHGLKIT